MLLSSAAAAFRPSQADSLNDLSLMPPVSVTTHALNFVAAEAAVTDVVEATLSVSVPRIRTPDPSTVTRRRILPINLSLYSFVNPLRIVLRLDELPTRHHHPLDVLSTATLAPIHVKKWSSSLGEDSDMSLVSDGDRGLHGAPRASWKSH